MYIYVYWYTGGGASRNCAPRTYGCKTYRGQTSCWGACMEIVLNIYEKRLYIYGKRPIYACKETYVHKERDLYKWKETYRYEKRQLFADKRASEVLADKLVNFLKRDLYTWRERPIYRNTGLYIWKETPNCGQACSGFACW